MHSYDMLFFFFCSSVFSLTSPIYVIRIADDCASINAFLLSFLGVLFLHSAKDRDNNKDSLFLFHSMFARRVPGSAAIPRAMFSKLHISSAAQANRMLPPLVVVSGMMGKSVNCGSGLFSTFLAGSDLVPADLEALPSMAAVLSAAPQLFFSCMPMNPVLLRMITDTMFTYSVILTSSS